MKISNYKKASRVFSIFSHPTRLIIAQMLLEKTKCVNDIKDMVKARQPNISQHLTLLRLNGIVECTQKGKMKCYCLKKPQLVKDILKLLNKNNLI